jgi:hypothetical protein
METAARPAMPRSPVGTSVRILAAVVGLIDLETGLWALVDPAGWYRSYPGFGHHWIAVQGPYNEHLAIDAGAGFLAVGAVLVIAAAWASRSTLTVALLALVVHAFPHFLFHVMHHVTGFSELDTLFGEWSLGVEAVVGLVLLWAMWRQRSWSRFRQS